MDRRDFLKAAGIAAASLIAAGPVRAKSQGRPNFVIFIADDIGWNDIGPYGNSGARTPNLDRLASEGMKFERAFFTCSSCSPTRCSIFTARYPHSMGAKELHQPLPPDQVVFAGLLKKAGYYTASAGKWHQGEPAKVNFDTVVGGGPSGCAQWVKTAKERPRDKPFLLWLAAIDAHRPYSKGTIDKPHTREDVFVPPYLPDTPEVRDDLALYYDEITRFDDYVGQVLAELDRQGVADSTFVLFLSDNGRPFPRCKTTIYDSGVQTPIIVRWPGKVAPGATCNSLISVIDIAPTIVELAGLEPSPTFQGRSFAKLLADPRKSIREYVFAEHNWHDYQAHERSTRSDKWLYIRNAFPHLPGTPPADAVRGDTFVTMRQLRDQGKLTADQMGCFIAPRPSEELYDVIADPFQLKNLAGDPDYAEPLAKMRRVLDDWIKRTDDKVDEEPTPDGFNRETGVRL